MSWISGNLVMPGVRLGVTMFVCLVTAPTLSMATFTPAWWGSSSWSQTLTRRDEWLHGRQPRPQPTGVHHSQIVSVNQRLVLIGIIIWKNFFCEYRFITGLPTVALLCVWMRSLHWVHPCGGVQGGEPERGEEEVPECRGVQVYSWWWR